MGLRFNGTSDYVTISNTDCVVTTEPFAVSAWVRKFGTGGTGAVWCGTEGTSVRCFLCYSAGLGPTSRALIRPYKRDAATGFAEGTVELGDGVWTHWLYVYASNTSRSGWTNGGDEQTNTTNVTDPAVSVEQLGRRNNASALWFNADMAEVAIYNTATWSAAEVGALAFGYSALLVKPQNLLSYYPLRDNVNSWTNTRHGTIFGAPIFVDHPPIIYPAIPSLSFVEPAPPVGIIPQAMHSYRRRRVG